MRKGGVHFAAVSLFVMLSVLLVCGLAQAQEKVIRLKYANFIPPAHKNAVLSEQFC